MTVTRLLIASMLICSTGYGVQAADRTFNIRLSHSLNANDPSGQAADKFKEIVERATNGTIKVAVFPNSQLGAEPEALQQVRQGSVEMTITAAGIGGNIVPDIAVLDAPYIWKDWDAQKKVLAGPVFQHFQKEFEETQGLKLLSAGWFYGTRVLTCNKAVRRPSDAEGLKIRTPASPVNLLSAEVLGGKGTPMAFAQVYLALKTGTIDCQENTPRTIISSKINEVQKYLMPTRHIQQAQIVMMNLAFWKGLSAEQQKAIQTAIDQAGDYAATLGVKSEDEDMKTFQNMKDFQVVNDIDMAAFVAKARELDPRLNNIWGDLYERILAEQK